MRYRMLTALAIVGVASLAAVSAQGATTAQLRAKCAAAWTGVKSGPAYLAYRGRCVAAANAATSNATDAGNPTNATANARRANAACNVQFKPPRNTAAKRKAFVACVKASKAAQVAFAGRPLYASLAGANEVPLAGPANGAASIRLNQGRNRICYTIVLTGLEGSTVVDAHIHSGTAGQAGPPVLQLSNYAGLNTANSVKGCEQGVPAALIKQIRQKPGDYYVNVHTVLYPGGAARGQLTK